MPRFGRSMPPGKRSLHEMFMREAAACGRMKPKDLERSPSPAMAAALCNMAAGRGPFDGLRERSAAGGADRTRHALIRRGWMAPDYSITDAGRAALARLSS